MTSISKVCYILIYIQDMMKLSSQSVDNNDLNLMEFFLVNTADSMIAVK